MPPCVGKAFTEPAEGRPGRPPPNSPIPIKLERPVRCNGCFPCSSQRSAIAYRELRFWWLALGRSDYSPVVPPYSPVVSYHPLCHLTRRYCATDCPRALRASVGGARLPTSLTGFALSWGIALARSDYSPVVSCHLTRRESRATFLASSLVPPYSTMVSCDRLLAVSRQGWRSDRAATVMRDPVGCSDVTNFKSHPAYTRLKWGRGGIRSVPVGLPGTGAIGAVRSAQPAQMIKASRPRTTATNPSLPPPAQSMNHPPNRL